MSLKLVVLFAAVAACSARYLDTVQGKYLVDIKGDTIMVMDQLKGRQVMIYTDRTTGMSDMYGQDMIYLTLNGPDMILKKFKVNDYQVETGLHQSDIILQVFKQFIGQLDDQMYLQLLTTIDQFVRINKIDPTILYTLKFLYYQDEDIMTELNTNMETKTRLGYYYGLPRDLGYNKYTMQGMLDTGLERQTYDLPMYTQNFQRYGKFYGPYSSDLYMNKMGMMRMMGMNMRDTMPQWWRMGYGGQNTLYNTMGRLGGMNQRLMNVMPGMQETYNTLPYYRYNTMMY